MGRAGLQPSAELAASCWWSKDRLPSSEQPSVPLRVRTLSRVFSLGKQVLQLRAGVLPRLTDGALGAATVGPTEMSGSLSGLGGCPEGRTRAQRGDVVCPGAPENCS